MTDLSDQINQMEARKVSPEEFDATMKEVCAVHTRRVCIPLMC
jgi:hypothetical protein